MGIQELVYWWALEGQRKSPATNGDPLKTSPGHFIIDLEAEWQEHRDGVFADLALEIERISNRVSAMPRKLSPWLSELLVKAEQAAEQILATGSGGVTVDDPDILPPYRAVFADLQVALGELSASGLADCSVASNFHVWKAEIQRKLDDIAEHPVRAPLIERLPLPLDGEFPVVDENAHWTEIEAELWVPFVKSQPDVHNAIVDYLRGVSQRDDKRDHERIAQKLREIVGIVRSNDLVLPLVYIAAVGTVLQESLPGLPRAYRDAHRTLSKSPICAARFLDSLFCEDQEERIRAFQWLGQSGISWMSYLHGPSEYAEYDENEQSFLRGTDIKGWIQGGRLLEAKAAWPVAQWCTAAFQYLMFWYLKKLVSNGLPDQIEQKRRSDEAREEFQGLKSGVGAFAGTQDASASVMTPTVAKAVTNAFGGMRPFGQTVSGPRHPLSMTLTTYRRPKTGRTAFTLQSGGSVVDLKPSYAKALKNLCSGKPCEIDNRAVRGLIKACPDLKPFIERVGKIKDNRAHFQAPLLVGCLQDESDA